MSDQTSWVTINDLVTQNAGRRLRVESNVCGIHYRGLRLGLPLTLPNVRQVSERDQRLRLDFDRGVLPGQQVVVRCRNSVKVEDFLNSFFFHSIFVQTLSDMCVLLSPVRQGAAIQPRG